jgi:hypothetical protein
MAKSQDTDKPTTDPVDALPNVTISGSVSAVLSECVEDYKWSNRLSRADVLKDALTLWANEHKLVEPARERLAAKIAE